MGNSWAPIEALNPKPEPYRRWPWKGWFCWGDFGFGAVVASLLGGVAFGPGTGQSCECAA